MLPLLSSKRQAVWLVSTEEFKRARYERRGKAANGAGTNTSDPERARRNHYARDLLLAQYVRRSAEGLGLTVLTIDGTRSLEEVADDVETHFGSYVQLGP